MALCALDFYYQHLGRHLAPDRSQVDSLTPSLPTRTKAGRELRDEDPAAPLPVRRIGTAMPAYYIVTEQGSRFLSNCEIPPTPEVTAVRIDNTEGKAQVKGNQYIAHWLYHEAPKNEVFLIGSVEKASPLASLELSLPPSKIVYCNTSGRTGRLSFDLDVFRHGVQVVEESGIPWSVVRHGIKLRDRMKRGEGAGKIREEVVRLAKKHPNLVEVVSQTKLFANSGEETMAHWFFSHDNVYGATPGTRLLT